MKKNGVAFSLHFTANLWLGFGRISISVCLHRLPMFLSSLKSVSSLLRSGGCQQHTPHDHTYSLINLENDADKEYLHFI